MRCFFCLECRSPSCEHVFAKAIGGRLTTDRVCKPCNDYLGREVDVLMTDHPFVVFDRWRLGLAGNSGKVPDGVLAMLGSGVMADDPEQRVRMFKNKATGSYEPRVLYRERTVTLQDGSRAQQIVIDASGGAAEVRKVIQRARKRAGVAPLPAEELERQVAAAIAGIQTIKQPEVKVSLQVDLERFKLALLKIAYEFACIWLGDGYLDDPVAGTLRDAIMGRVPLESSLIEGDMALGVAHPPVRFWAAERDSLVAYAYAMSDGRFCISLKVLGSMSGTVIVSRSAGAHAREKDASERNRFLHIDAAKGTMRETSFLDEFQRISRAAALDRRSRTQPSSPAS